MTIDKKNKKGTTANEPLYQENPKSDHRQLPSQRSSQEANWQASQASGQLPIRQVKRRFFLLLGLAIVLIAVLIWLTLTVLEANNIEPFGEIAALATLSNQA